jgi:hypothetical protein
MIDNEWVVNESAYMDFKGATDVLFSRVDHAELAKALKVSVASIRQARLRRSAKAFREPPPNWPEAVIRLAEHQIGEYQKLIKGLQGNKS